MDRANAARIQEWDARPLTGGYRGLRELSDANFSGAVTTGTAWLFMLNGRIVGLVDGTMASFESTDATAHEAPDPSLPLLFAMKERGGEIQAKYYSDDNPLPQVHETLAEASFTGYVELSDNVLSGDYYVVYYGGKSMSAAFVGNAERLVSGDDAFRQAAEEVGIYEVRAVELDVREVPEPAETGDAAAPAERPADGAGGGGSVGEEPTHDAPVDEAEAPADAVPEAEPADAVGGEPPPADAPGSTGDAPGEAADGPPASEPADAAAGPPAGGPPGEGDDESGDPFSQEAAWREARTIPALDPEETDRVDGAAVEPAEGAAEPADVAASQPTEPAAEAASNPPEGSAEESAADARLSELEHAVESQSATIEELQAERNRLESQLQASRSGGDGSDAGPTGQPLDAETALDQTDLFVRYGTKGGGTLEKAHDGALDREEVVENLRIEHHTRFEADEVSVDGRPFEPFLGSTVEYRFVEWLVTHLLFEILDTGSQRGLRDLFDAIPLIDRAEFRGSVTVDVDEGEGREETFDVVCRDRMGQPLVVANINDVRDPATGEMMTGLVEAASSVGTDQETLGGVFMVTSSFFQPDALETAAEATGGGLLAREKRWSYVKLGRKRGYHLCLVEARGDDFHVAVPEL